ncbi:putative leucine-rich repeat domain, L domain-containing protein [Rosa chinensis]|uniref:Putative leucine-rich repeat domain, L domain-containing protein n=2 Tax=Rosa chinensis TaxID=74649 RepID=A0A2P6RUN1_ROSCH|nr:putative leucine-rich repeat domain, L domain-containing protein [Rosa chinensis]
MQSRSRGSPCHTTNHTPPITTLLSFLDSSLINLKTSMSAAAAAPITDLPEAILATIIGLVSDTRSRNSVALVCRKFRSLERATRTSLKLRGNARDLHLIPTCFTSVSDLDLSLLSPWGHALLSPSASSTDPALLAQRLRVAFPSVTSLTVYSRSSSTVQIVANLWPGLRRVKLVRWHLRPQSPLGADFEPLFQQCQTLSDLDLSEFYYWTEDLPPVLEAHPNVARSLTKLNLLTASITEGFKAIEIRSITEACPKLQQLFVACIFDPRYIGIVGEEALLAISTNCPELRVVHLIDTSSLANARGDPNDDGFTSEDAQIGRAALIDFFSGLPLLEELVLDVCKNVRDSGLALEVLASKCPRLRALKLGQFHGLCSAVGSQLDGIALCHGLESLSIKNSADLTDMGLIEIARGCCKLAKFEVYGCKKITVKGLRTLACLLRKTLVDVSISCCKNLDAAGSVCALEPIRDRIQRLHIDCVWPRDFDLNQVNDYDVGDDESVVMSRNGNDDMDLKWSDEYEHRISKKCKYGSDGDCSYMPTNGYANGNGFWSDETWERLQYLSLWIEVGELLTSLPEVGLDECPNLEEIQIRVEGDCRGRHKPTQREFGLSCLSRFPRLSKMKLDCGDTVGFALTAPPGQMDLSLWERFFLSGIGELSLSEVDYWPPQDRDVNQRSLWLPAAGLLAECITLRKLFIHGTAHEHFMMFLVRNPNLNLSLRDVQLREDYYPAPENEMSTEMRVDSCCRFEDALNRRTILD